MYYCRVHGEPLIRNEQQALFECPERTICGTYVADEFIYVAGVDIAQGSQVTISARQSRRTGVIEVLDVDVQLIDDDFWDRQIRAFVKEHLWGGLEPDEWWEKYRSEYEGRWYNSDGA